MGNKIHRYVVTHDDGSAPCIDNDLLTLCICKPEIRKTAQIDDWLIGFTSVGIARSLSVDISSVIYIAKVTEKSTMQEYFLDKESHVREIEVKENYITPFEKKYALSGQQIYELKIS